MNETHDGWLGVWAGPEQPFNGKKKERSDVRWVTVLMRLLIGVSLLLCSCLGPVMFRPTQQQTIIELDKTDRLTQKVAAVLSRVPATALGHQTGELYFATLLERIGDKNSHVRLVTNQDEHFPVFMQAFTTDTSPTDLTAITESARLQGYQGIISAAVLDIHAKAEENGILWWRKTRFYLSLAVSLDLYDPFSGSKIISRVETDTIKIDQMEYQQLSAGRAVPFEDLDDAVIGMADKVGGQAADALAEVPWKTVVTKVDGQDIELAGGEESGLAVGDSLIVFEGRRWMKGPNGEQFIVPGYKVGRIDVTAVEDNTVRAAAGKPGVNIAVDDIAVAR
jgi:hypothetical protein